MQPQRGTNLPRVKAYNEAFVLDFVRLRGRVSRRKIADASGLTFQTVSNIVERLLEAELLEEELGASGGRGRQSRLVWLNEDAAYAVGIQLSHSALTVAVTNLAAKVLAHQHMPYASSEGPSAILSSIRDRVHDLTTGAEVPLERVLGVGMGVPGPIDLDAGRLRNVPNFAGWEGFPVQAEMERLLGRSVLIDRNATAAALGEQWSGVAKETSDFIYIYVGEGVGVGIVAGREAYRGATGNSGDVAHICVKSGGVICHCGRVGCLAMYATVHGVEREIRRVLLETEHLQGREIPRGEGFSESLIDDPRLPESISVGVIEAAGTYLGQIVSRLVGTLDPELVVLGGPAMSRLGEPYKRIVEQLLTYDLTPSRTVPRVELSTGGELAGAIGAATLVLHDLFAFGPERLSLNQSPANDRIIQSF